MTQRFGRWQSQDMREDALQDAVMDGLQRFGWKVTHHRRSDAAMTMGDPGEPDIRGIRDGRALWIECKSHRGRLSDGQAAWLSHLAMVPDAVVRVIRPDDLDAFLQELQRTQGRLDVEGIRISAELRRHELHAVTHAPRRWAR